LDRISWMFALSGDLRSSLLKAQSFKQNQMWLGRQVCRPSMIFSVTGIELVFSWLSGFSCPNKKASVLEIERKFVLF
jgi:hypothetical protein